MTEQAHVPGSRRTLLVGAGKVGARLGQRLVERGDRVFGLRRDPSSLPSAFTPIAADLSAPLTNELPDVDAMVITLTPGRPAPTLDDSAYLASLRHLADALPSRPDRVVFVSSTGVSRGVPRVRSGGRVTPQRPRPTADDSSWQVSAPRSTCSAPSSCDRRGSMGQDASSCCGKCCTGSPSRCGRAPTGSMSSTS